MPSFFDDNLDEDFDEHWKQEEPMDWFDKLCDRIEYAISRMRATIAGWFGGW